MHVHEFYQEKLMQFSELSTYTTYSVDGLHAIPCFFAVQMNGFLLLDPCVNSRLGNIMRYLKKQWTEGHKAA